MAQEVPRILNFSKNDYRAQNQNWSIAQSSAGEMFFGNGEGLLRFDGTMWLKMPLPNKQTVRSVATNNNLRIYVGGFAAFGFFEKNAFGNLEYTDLSKEVTFEKVKKEEIWHIVATPKAVYFQSFSTIYKYDFQKVSVLNPPDNIMFLRAVNGRLIVPVIAKGLYELTTNNDFKFMEGSAFLAQKIVSTLLPFGNDGLLIGTARDGIFVFDNGVFKEWAASAQALSRDFQLNKGVQLSNGNYAFGTILNGIYLLKPDGSTIFHINKENGLQNNTVLSMHEDHAKNLWVGLDKGIDLVDLTMPITFFQDRSGKIGSVYAAAVFNRKLFVGTNQGLFFKEENSKENFKLLNGTQGQVWDIQNVDNQLFIGHNTGSFILNENNVLSKISDITGGWCLIPFRMSDMGFRAEQPKSDNRNPTSGALFLQGTYTGIVVYRKDRNQQWSFVRKINDFPEPTKKIAFDKAGNLWAINAYYQLFRVKISENIAKNAQNTEGGTAIKIGTTVKYDFSKMGEELYFKADDGYYTFENERFQKVNNKSWENAKICEGTDGDVLKIRLDAVEVVHKNKPTSRLRLKLIPNYETLVALDSSRYLFGLDDGYAIFNKKNPPNNAVFSPKSIVRLFAKDGAIFNFYPSDSAKNSWQLPPQYRALRIDVALPFFTDAARFSYFLSGHAAEWSPFESATSHEFANLSAGKHELRVKNDVSDVETVIEFEILPYWYETVWAKMAYFAAFIGVVFLFFRFHKIQLDNQRLRIEAGMLRELEQERIRADNDRLHADNINKSQELANSTMGIIRKNEILIDIKEQLDGLKSEHGARFPEKNYKKLSEMIETNLSSEENWRIFEQNFNEVHEDFLKRLNAEFTDLTAGDLKLAAYLRMNLTSKEISPLLYISIRGIENKRYRLRKKLNLHEEDNLSEFILKY
jgi:ligand-binding sensor domain-containing protein